MKLSQIKMKRKIIKKLEIYKFKISMKIMKLKKFKNKLIKNLNKINNLQIKLE